MFAPLPAGPFDVVVVDPPWSYTGQQDKWGAAAKFYQTVSTGDLAGLPVGSVLARRAVVFMWTTGPKMREAVWLGRQWGLHYRSVGFVWVKTRRDGTPIGAQGVRPSITKQLTEFCLAWSTVPTGRPIPLADESIVQTVLEPVGRHSEKPAAVQDRIDRMYPQARRLELFARASRPGWVAWGLEAPA
jgi:N6-adenosine-specific RNA methylase IME4